MPHSQFFTPLGGTELKSIGYLLIKINQLFQLLCWKEASYELKMALNPWAIYLNRNLNICKQVIFQALIIMLDIHRHISNKQVMDKNIQ